MKPCPEYLDELALAAGCDLPVEEERLVLAHAESCPGCAEQLARLVADQGLLARASRVVEAPESLAPVVLAAVATEAHESAVRALRTTSVRGEAGPLERGTRASFVSFARVAAVAAVLVSVGLLGLGSLSHDAVNAPEGAMAGAGPEVAVRRLPGEAIELSWAGDGREGAETAAGRPYTVLASADPKDFAAAKVVEVAGRRLVTDVPLPAARQQDRKITYFRVQ